jgi:hypothetical protein
MVSTGDNRYNCFHCDFDLCVNCVRLKGGENAVVHAHFDFFPATTLTEDSDSEPPSASPVTASQETLLATSALLEQERPPPSYNECMIRTYGDFV